MQNQGRSPIVQVLAPGQRPTKKGLIFAATLRSDFICGTQQMASGITVQSLPRVAVPYGLAAVPVIKWQAETILQTVGMT